MQLKEIVEDVQPGREPSTSDQPDQVTGPLYGVPVSEVRAWIESQATGNKLPTPKARRVR